MSRNDYPQGIVVKQREYAEVSLIDRRESRILRAFGFSRADLASAKEPSLLRSLDNGQAFLVKEDENTSFVCVKLNGHNAGGGDNSVAIGGKFRVFGEPHDFSTGSVIIGVQLNAVVFPIKGKVFNQRERRALRHA